MLDLRLPIGWYFIINAVLLLICSILNGKQSMVPLNHEAINLNLCWGIVMGLFGVLMASLSYRDKARSKQR